MSSQKIPLLIKCSGKYDKESLYLKRIFQYAEIKCRERDKIHLQRELQNIQQDYNNEKR